MTNTTTPKKPSATEATRALSIALADREARARETRALLADAIRDHATWAASVASALADGRPVEAADLERLASCGVVVAGAGLDVLARLDRDVSALREMLADSPPVVARQAPTAPKGLTVISPPHKPAKSSKGLIPHVLSAPARTNYYSARAELQRAAEAAGLADLAVRIRHAKNKAEVLAIASEAFTIEG